MKKFLMVLGAIFAVPLIGFVVVAIRGSALDRESKTYADTAAIAIVSDWSTQALFDRASPDFMKTTTREQVDSLFAQLRVLGRMTKYDGSKGDSSSFYNVSARTLTITAVYFAHAEFEHGSAQIKITVLKRGGYWQIVGFYVQGRRNPEGPAKWSSSIASPVGHLI